KDAIATPPGPRCWRPNGRPGRLRSSVGWRQTILLRMGRRGRGLESVANREFECGGAFISVLKRGAPMTLSVLSGATARSSRLTTPTMDEQKSERGKPG